MSASSKRRQISSVAYSTAFSPPERIGLLDRCPEQHYTFVMGMWGQKSLPLRIGEAWNSTG